MLQGLTRQQELHLCHHPLSGITFCCFVQSMRSCLGNLGSRYQTSLVVLSCSGCLQLRQEAYWMHEKAKLSNLYALPLSMCTLDASDQAGWTLGARERHGIRLLMDNHPWRSAHMHACPGLFDVNC